ncbi:hypothetical protein MMC19_004247 [Ptychographa xylographoides]|nr:hypothetical protein [Ptychographa xylographoides]
MASGKLGLVPQAPLWKRLAALPAELRLKIHKNVLVVGKLFPGGQTILSPKEEIFEVPEVGWLMLLHRMDVRLVTEGFELDINFLEEAQSVLFGLNTVVLHESNISPFLLQRRFGGYPADGSKLYVGRNKFVRSVEVDLTESNSTLSYQHRVDPIINKAWKFYPEEEMQTERLEYIHDLAEDLLIVEHWGPVFTMIRQLKLDSLVIDVSNCLCYHGCCRLIEFIAAEQMRFVIQVPKQLVLRGAMKDEQEKVRQIVQSNYVKR